MTEILDQRAQHILKILVERYIQEGSPIGSKTLAAEHAIGLSSATVRNILADLEALGYLSSPHTSAGRIPTEQGYRFFVDCLVTIKPLEGTEVQELKTQLHSELEFSNLLQSASTVLSTMTGMAAVVALPKRDRVIWRHVEFLPLSGNRILMILVLNNREVQNRIIYMDRIYTQNELQEVSNFLNAQYSGKDLQVTRKELLDAIHFDQQNMMQLLQTTIDITNKAFLDPKQKSKNYIIAGQENLIRCAHESNLEQLHLLFSAFSQKQDALSLLNHALEAQGIQIFIGKEAGHQVFDHCSIVAASYSGEGELLGTLGVIGPTRMAYDRVISAVDVTAKLLSAALNQP